MVSESIIDRVLNLNVLQLRAILHDPAVYPEPHVFRPERFLTTDGKLNPQVKDPDAAWGFGRRLCPGRRMATSTMFITIASVLATFEISTAFDNNGRAIVPSAEYGVGMLRLVFNSEIIAIGCN